jgi:hypothetical protein
MFNKLVTVFVEDTPCCPDKTRTDYLPLIYLATPENDTTMKNNTKR